MNISFSERPNNKRRLRSVTLVSREELEVTRDACSFSYAQKLDQYYARFAATPFAVRILEAGYPSIKNMRLVRVLADKALELLDKPPLTDETVSPHLQLTGDLASAALGSIVEYQREDPEGEWEYRTTSEYMAEQAAQAGVS